MTTPTMKSAESEECISAKVIENAINATERKLMA